MHLSIVNHYSCLLKDLNVDKYSHDYLISRLKNEGPRFITVVLPSLFKVVLTSIERGYFDYSECTSFARKKKLPRLFHGLFCKIFSTKGILLDDADAQALLTIRQACEYYYKCSFAFTPAELIEAEEKYLSVEAELSDDSTVNWDRVEDCRKAFETYYGPMSSTPVEDILQHSRPRFGPGSCVVPPEAEYLMEKPPKHTPFRQKRTGFTNQDIKLAPGSLVGTCNHSQRAHSGFFKAYPSSKEEIRIVAEGRKTEVLFVPKDSRGPRVISKEPMFLLKMQMSFLKWGCDMLEKVTDRRINFADQTINRELARRGSIDQSWSTFDLKEASDRVRHSVARRIFSQSPGFRYFINHQRSTHFELPSDVKSAKESCKAMKTAFSFNRFSAGRKLNKLSGMGSGITFPTMALIIHLAICTHVKRCTGLPYREIMRNVYVYGDDVIVPKDYSRYVQYALESVGLVVNTNKSFQKGFFRESCGGDYLHGNEVMPVRFKMSGSKLPTVDQCRHGIDLDGTSAIVNLERHARELVIAGLTKTADYIYRLIEKELKVPLPLGSGPVPYLSRYTTDWNEPFSQGVIRKAYLPKPIDVLAKEPCPHKHLKTVLDRESDRSRVLWNERQDAFRVSLKATWAGNDTSAEDSIQDTIDDALESTTRILYGHANTRYAVGLTAVKNVPAFCMSMQTR